MKEQPDKEYYLEFGTKFVQNIIQTNTNDQFLSIFDQLINLGVSDVINITKEFFLQKPVIYKRVFNLISLVIKDPLLKYELTKNQALFAIMFDTMLQANDYDHVSQNCLNIFWYLLSEFCNSDECFSKIQKYNFFSVIEKNLKQIIEPPQYHQQILQQDLNYEQRKKLVKVMFKDYQKYTFILHCLNKFIEFNPELYTLETQQLEQDEKEQDNSHKTRIYINVDSISLVLNYMLSNMQDAVISHLKELVEFNFNIFFLFTFVKDKINQNNFQIIQQICDIIYKNQHIDDQFISHSIKLILQQLIILYEKQNQNDEYNILNISIIITDLNMWMKQDDIPYEYLILLFSKINLKHPKLDSKTEKFSKTLIAIMQSQIQNYDDPNSLFFQKVIIKKIFIQLEIFNDENACKSIFFILSFMLKKTIYFDEEPIICKRKHTQSQHLIDQLHQQGLNLMMEIFIIIIHINVFLNFMLDNNLFEKFYSCLKKLLQIHNYLLFKNDFSSNQYNIRQNQMSSIIKTASILMNNFSLFNQFLTQISQPNVMSLIFDFLIMDQKNIQLIFLSTISNLLEKNDYFIIKQLIDISHSKLLTLNKKLVFDSTQKYNFNAIISIFKNIYFSQEIFPNSVIKEQSKVELKFYIAFVITNILIEKQTYIQIDKKILEMLVEESQNDQQLNLRVIYLVYKYQEQSLMIDNKILILKLLKDTFNNNKKILIYDQILNLSEIPTQQVIMQLLHTDIRLVKGCQSLENGFFWEYTNQELNQNQLQFITLNVMLILFDCLLNNYPIYNDITIEKKFMDNLSEVFISELNNNIQIFFVKKICEITKKFIVNIQGVKLEAFFCSGILKIIII